MKKIIAKRIKIAVGVLLIVFVSLVIGYKINLNGGFSDLAFAPSVADFEKGSSGGFAESFNVAQDSVATRSSLVMPAPDGAFVDNGLVDEAATRSIIKNGNLDLIVVSVEDTLKEVKNIANKLKGAFVAEASVQEVNDGQKTGWIRLRVPSDNFDVVLDQLKNLAVKVESENVQADDVTRQVVDTEARLNSLRAQEVQFAEILKTANTVEDVLKVTEQLNRVRNEIEQYELQLKNLSEQVSLSTIFVSLTDEGNVKIFGIYWRPLLSIKQAVRDALENLTGSVDFLFSILFNLPLLFVWGCILYLAVWLLKKLYFYTKKRKWWR